MERPDLLRRLDAIESLPTLPSIYERVAELAEDPSASATRFGEVIASDQALAARILRIVNSPVYGFPRRISSITRAIVLLGFENLRQVVLFTTVVDLFARPPGRGLHLARFWEHALATGILAKSIAARRQERSEEVFVAALLHDLGKLVLDHVEPDGYRTALERVRDERRPLIEVEEETFGAGHPEVGARVLDRWGLPRQLVEVVAHHHRPSESSIAQEQAFTVQLADALVNGVGWGRSGNPWVPRVEENLLARLEIEPDALVEALSAAERELEEARHLFLPETVA